MNAKTLEHPGHCSVLGAGLDPRTGVRWGGVWSLFSDIMWLAGMHTVTTLTCLCSITTVTHITINS